MEELTLEGLEATSVQLCTQACNEPTYTTCNTPTRPVLLRGGTRCDFACKYTHI